MVMRAIAKQLPFMDIQQSVSLLVSRAPDILKHLELYHAKNAADFKLFLSTVKGMAALNDPTDGRDPLMYARVLAQDMTKLTHALGGTESQFADMQEKLIKLHKMDSHMPGGSRVSAFNSLAARSEQVQPLANVRAPSVTTQDTRDIIRFLRERVKGVRMELGACWSCYYIDPSRAVPRIPHSAVDCDQLQKAMDKRARDMGASRRY